jgi:hypothetical protein
MDTIVTNTGNSPLANLSFTAAPAGFTRVTSPNSAFPTIAPPCTPTAPFTLNPGASCTVRYTFAPGVVQNYGGNVTVSATGATITPNTVSLSGTGVSGKATVQIKPNPAFIELDSAATPNDPNAYTNVAAVTLTNPATNVSQVSITGVAVTKTSGPGTLSIGTIAGQNTCTGKAVAPGASCTVAVRYTVGTADARSAAATATAVIGAGGAITGVTVTAGGSGYTFTPTVSVIDGTGNGATFQATVVGGVVTKITPLTGGAGYDATTVLQVQGALDTRGTITFTDTGLPTPSQVGQLGGIANP